MSSIYSGILSWISPVLAVSLPQSTRGTIILELVICGLLLILLVLLKKRFMKLMCLCGAEICLWLTCKLAFGSKSLPTQIMNWITAAVTCILVISIVSHIDWGNLRGDSDNSQKSDPE